MGPPRSQEGLLLATIKAMLRNLVRCAVVVSCLSLLAFPQEKEKGGGGEHKPDKDQSLAMEDFSKAMALQADDIQKDQLAAITKCSGDIDRALGEPAKADSLKTAQTSVTCVEKNWKDFSKDLTKPQRNGLKAKLQAANKAGAELDHASGSSSSDAAHLKSANAEFFAALQSLASDMGVELKK